MIRVAEHLTPSRVVDLRSRSRDAALMELVETLADAPEVTDRDKVLAAVLEREKTLSTGIGLGVAVPHAKIPEVHEFLLVYGRSREGIDFTSIDDRPVHHVAMIVGPHDRQARYLQFLSSVISTFKQAELRRNLELAAGPAELHAILSR
ncbi:MAG: PTS system fructose-specific EIIABC component [Planctomycetes bacterium]|nr:PTS system fructose-specific EIIABC component [Planctomycetota bacterium]